MGLYTVYLCISSIKYNSMCKDRVANSLAEQRKLDKSCVPVEISMLDE